jgi:demethylmenaquinone methyltransferase/2-methoxy-6-polyprenyl-1,4-benzoquinol methylase
VKEYYDTRAPEYDDWYLGHGRFADRDRSGWDEELAALAATIEALPPKRTVDVACGTGFLTQHLRGDVTGLDQSAQMLAIAAERAPTATFVQGDAFELPFENGSFERVFTGHFYGHLEEAERRRFLAEAHRVTAELVVVDASRTHSEVDEQWAPRVLRDGSRWEVYKRWFTPPELLAELGGGDVLLAGHWFLVVRSPR